MRHYGRRPAGREETGAMLGSVTTAAEALALCESKSPQILITTDQLEDGDGLDLVRQAHDRWPELPILLILKQLTIPRLHQALQAGSQGILADALILEGNVFTALQALLRGDHYFDPSLGALLQDGVAGCNPRLSAKQLQVLMLLVSGDSDRQIAVKLELPIDTVKYNIKQIYRVLGVGNRASAVLMALRLGMVSVPPLTPQPLSPGEMEPLLRKLKVDSGG
jgi:DNA-binding NarL/FixJ family response regulator